MNDDILFEKLKADLKIAAENFRKLLPLTIIFKHESFSKQKTYSARFYVENFMHLTGIKSSLSPTSFYYACLNGTLTLPFLLNFPKEYRSIIKCKVKNLIKMDSYFKSSLLVQENYERNSVSCAIATSDGYKTIGFTCTSPYIRPMTIMNKNKLNADQEILDVKPIIKKYKEKVMKNEGWKCQIGVKLFLDQGTSLRVIYLDGQTRKYDMKNLFKDYPNFKALKDRKLFLKGELHTFSIDWTDDIDVDVVCPYYEGEPYDPGEDAKKYITEFRERRARLTMNEMHKSQKIKLKDESLRD